MALKSCPECKNEVSDKAKSCPKCGAPLQVSRKASPLIWIFLSLAIVGVAVFLYFQFNASSDSQDKIVIPEGAYVLEKSPDKGVIKFLESASSNLRGLGDHLTVYGDSVVQSTGAISNLIASIDGNSTRFKLQKTATDNQFLLYLNSTPVPLELTDTKELKITLGSISLIYQKQ